MSLEVTSLDFEGMNGTDRRRIELGYGELQSIYLQYDEKSCSRFAIMFYAMAGCGNWSFFATLSVEMPTTLLGILGAVVKSRSQRLSDRKRLYFENNNLGQDSIKCFVKWQSLVVREIANRKGVV